MKKFLSLLASFGLLFGNLGIATAATATASAVKADHFEVTVAATAKVQEALDVTIKAVDKAGNQVKNYLGTVYITVETDPKATVPYEEGYTFVTGDQGTKTFSKGLAFSKEGKMKVTVVDIDTENLEGSATVTVTAGSASQTQTAGDITITSPANGDSIPDTKTTVNGTTKKNSKVQIFLNGKKIGDTQSDDTGNFLFPIKTLEQDQNVIQAKLLDGTDKVIASTDQISITVSATGPAFQALTLKEGNEVAPGTLLNASVSAEAGLKEVLVTLNGIDQIFTPGKGSDYVGSLTAPAKVGDYPVKVKLTNSLGKVTTKDEALTLKVVEAQPVDLFKNIKAEKGDKKVTFTFELIKDDDKIVKFKIKYGKSTIAPATTGTSATSEVTADTTATGSDEMTTTGTSATDAGAKTVSSVTNSDAALAAPVLDKESITFEKAKIMKDGKYSWYVSGLDIAPYSFELYALDKDGKELPGYLKASSDVDLSLAAAGKCSISNIAGLKVTKKGDVSELTWESVPEATSYNVYKKDKDGKWQLIENVATNKYTINITGKQLVYEDFAVKGMCGEKEMESADYSNVTKVQTGPGLLILLAASGAIGYFIMRRKFAR
jgi:hypothetical protein